MPSRGARLAWALAAAALFVLALGVLRRQLHATSWDITVAAIRDTPRWALAGAAALTALNFVVLAGYDLLALVSARTRLPRWRVALVAMTAYGVANGVGIAMASGAAVRYRFYRRWGLGPGDLIHVVVAYSITFWLGLLTLGGLCLAWLPLPLSPTSHVAALLGPASRLLLMPAVLYLAAATMWRRPIRAGQLTLSLPELHVAVAQLVVSMADWTLAAGVLYVLLPAPAPPFGVVLGAFLAAQILALASHVPGGAGVFEALIVALLAPWHAPAALVPALVVYRGIYYALPLAASLTVLAADAVRQHRRTLVALSASVASVSSWLTPRLLAALTFLAGLVLLLSGATPAADGRLSWIARFLPLGVIESSHFAASVAGAVLLLVSQSLAGRLDAAYYVTASGLGVGIVGSLLKGADVEEAVLLSGLLIALHHSRSMFDRRARLFDAPLSAQWMIASACGLAASVWLGLFAFSHVEYSNDLWWQFALDGQASRFLRGSVGAAVVALLFAVARLIGPRPHRLVPPGDDELAAARAVIGRQSTTLPSLIELGDKALLFDAHRTAFVMYGVQGRTWVALGDPVGPAESGAPLVGAFMRQCDHAGGVPVFYQVRPERLRWYVDHGLTCIRLGEEASVDLTRFSLDGGRGARARQALRRLDKAGATFRVVEPVVVPPLLDALQQVSDDWLDHKAGAEKGFSLGYFNRAYVARWPIAVVERGDAICAFANLWPGADRVELSVDLMRYRRDAPKDVMESLFVHLLLWSRQQGYERFVLGMAPMSGFEQSPVGPMWNRVGRLLYERGGALYNFKGLRAYKEKFDPVWEPRYLAYPGGLVLPRVLADVSALIAGGYRRALGVGRSRATLADGRDGGLIRRIPSIP